MSPVGGPQSVPSRISVVLVEETEVRCAERLAAAPEDKEVRLLASMACPAGETISGSGIVMPGTVGTLSPSDSDTMGPDGPVGTLSPSDSDSVGPVGPDGTLSSSDLTGILFPAIPAGILFPAGPVGPVGPDGTLSSSDHAGILFSAVPAGILFPAGPVGTLSLSNFGSVGPVGPVGTLSLSDHEGVLSSTVPVGELSLVDPDNETPGGGFKWSGRNFRTGRIRLLRSFLLNCLSGTLGRWGMWT